MHVFKKKGNDKTLKNEKDKTLPTSLLISMNLWFRHYSSCVSHSQSALCASTVVSLRAPSRLTVRVQLPVIVIISAT